MVDIFVWSRRHSFRVLSENENVVFYLCSLVSLLVCGLSIQAEHVTANKTKPSSGYDVTNRGENDSTIVVDPNCKACTSNDEGCAVGVVAGSVLAGAVMGAVITAAVIFFLNNRSRALPPKDYNEEDLHICSDVNRNSDGDPVQKDNGKALDLPTSKAHKKLGRFIHQDQSSKHDHKTEPAVVPLIHHTDSFNSNVKEDHAANQNSPVKSANIKESAASYLNVGDVSFLSQPYDSLSAVPEEVEYENQNVYEPLREDEKAS